MPENDFDIDSTIDRAFADLLEDVGSRTAPPSASTIIERARRRRTTTFAAAAAVVLIIGAAAVASGVGRPSAAPGPSGQLPAPQVLDRDAWASATNGWVDGWKEPSDNDSLAWLDNLQDPSCFASLPDDSPEPDRTGRLMLISGSRTAAIGVLADFDDPTQADTTWRQLTGAITGCADANLVQQVTWDGAEAESYLIDRAQGHDYFWFARDGQKMAFVWLVGDSTPLPAETDTRVMTTLVAGLQAPGSFRTPDSSSIDSGSASAEASPVAVPQNSVMEKDFADALGSWDSGWQRRSDKVADVRLPCFSPEGLTGSSGSMGGFGSSVGSNGSYEAAWFSDQATASLAFEDLYSQLESCATPYVVDRVGSQPEVLVASSDAGLLWIVHRGTVLGSIAIDGGHADPPAEVSTAVGALISRALRTTTP